MNRALLRFSSLMGLGFGLISAAVLWFADRASTLLALPAAVLFGAMLYLFMLFDKSRTERKYKAMQEQIGGPVLHTADAVARMGKRVLSVRIFFLKDRMMMFSAESRQGLIKTIRYADITAWDAGNPRRLVVWTGDEAAADLHLASALLLESLRDQVGLDFRLAEQ